MSLCLGEVRMTSYLWIKVTAMMHLFSRHNHTPSSGCARITWGRIPGCYRTSCCGYHES
uniref:Uncharacterized protein n=1 Tax=Anguilla anguilla TaxID=7936 RepID=A0A0E9WUJ9_ANGAN